MCVCAPCNPKMPPEVMLRGWETPRNSFGGIYGGNGDSAKSPPPPASGNLGGIQVINWHVLWYVVSQLLSGISTDWLVLLAKLLFEGREVLLVIQPFPPLAFKSFLEALGADWQIWTFPWSVIYGLELVCLPLCFAVIGDVLQNSPQCGVG